MTRRFWLFALMLILVGCGETAESAPLVVSAESAPPNLVNGRIVPFAEVKLGFPIDGQITEWLVEPGTVITAGQPLARLDTRFLELQIAEADAAVNQATATLERVRVSAAVAQGNDLDAAEPLPTPTPNALSNAQIDEAVAALELANVKQSAAALLLQQATLNAPIGGLLGQHLVLSGEQVQAGQAVAILGQQPQADQWRIKTDDLSELDVGRLTPGQTLTVTIDAFQERQFTATIAQIEPQPTIERGVVNYTLLLDITIPADTAVRWGMSVRIQMP